MKKVLMMNRSSKLNLFMIITILLLACNLPVALSPTLSPVPDATEMQVSISTPTPIPAATNTPVATTTSVSTRAPLYQSVWLESIEYEESGQKPDYTLTTHTPILRSDGDYLEVANFNALTAAFVQRDVESFQEILAEMSPESLSAGSFYELSFTQLSPQGNLISLQFIVDAYMDGAAHPFRVIHSFNYDLEAGQEIQLEALFISGADYLKAISDYCITELNNRDIGAWPEGAAPTPENYRVWNITSEGLLITFNEYQVAPYAAGPQTVNIPSTILQDLLIPGLIP